MKIVSFQSQSGPRFGYLDGTIVRDAGDSLSDLHTGEAVGPLDRLTLLPPIPAPGKIICVGLNYRSHAAEAGLEAPDRPILFAKLTSSLIGHNQSIRLPRISSEIDYEAELAVVIGRRVRGAIRSRALDYVLGYSCLNDVSARDLQAADGQWLRAKSLDTFCPMGPWVVTADEVPDPQNLAIRCRLNGRLVQDSNTSRMVFSVAELISFISESITLEAGDVISTGTPEGVGVARIPPLFLRAGDVVGVEIDQVGSLENPVASDED